MILRDSGQLIDSDDKCNGRSNGKREEYIPLEVTSEAYYQSLGLKHKINNIDVSIREVDRLTIEDMPVTFSNRAIFKRVEFTHDLLNVPCSFFIKIDNPLRVARDISTENRDIEILIRKNLEDMKLREKKIAYQFEHLEFWEKIGINTPRIFDYVSSEMLVNNKTDIEVLKKLQGGEFNESEKSTIVSEALIQDFWPGLSYDLEIITIQNLIASKDLQRIDKFTPEYEKIILGGEVEKLKSELDSIVVSTLESLAKLSILGTYHINTNWKSLHLDTPSNPVKYYGKKLHNFTTSLILWNQINSNSLNLDVLADREEYLNVRRDINEKLRDIQDVLDFVLSPFLRKNLFVYTHGDENFSNFQEHNINSNVSNDNSKRNTGIFDADRVQKTLYSRSIARILSSHLIDLPLDGVMSYFNRHRNHLDNFVNGNTPYKSIINLGPTPEKDFLLLYLNELMSSMGRKSLDSLFYKKHSEKFWNRIIDLSGSDVGLRLSNLNIERPVSITPNLHRSDVAIPKLKNRMGDSLASMIDGDYKKYFNRIEKYNLERLREFCHSYGTCD